MSEVWDAAYEFGKDLSGESGKEAKKDAASKAARFRDRQEYERKRADEEARLLSLQRKRRAEGSGRWSTLHAGGAANLASVFAQPETGRMLLGE